MNGATASQDLQVTTSPEVAIDPLRAVRRLGRRASRDGIYVGLIIALLSHFSAYAAPQYTLWEMSLVVGKMQTELHGYFVSAYDVELLGDDDGDDAEEVVADDEEEDDAVEDQEEEVEDDVDPDTSVTQADQTQDTAADETDDEEDDPYDDEEPEDTAEAADIQTAPEDDAVDLSKHFTMVDKDGSKSTGGGFTSSKGKSKKAVHNPNARSGGKGRRGSKGKGKGKKKSRGKKKGRDLSRGLRGSSSAFCPFPPQADLHQIDKATVVLSVTVSGTGRVTSASVVSDPGWGFGAAAKRCIYAQTFPPALDKSGKPITKTGQVNYRFNR
jgi:periplasmic protein TonB